MPNGKAHSTVRFLPPIGRRATLVGLYLTSPGSVRGRRVEFERGGVGSNDEPFTIYFAELTTL